MPNSPILLVPGLNCTPDAFQHLIPALWPFGPVTVANHTEGDGVSAIARNTLRDAPPSFSLLGFSMGGYIAFEILRQAPHRVLRLCLLDTSARPDTAEAAEKRHAGIAKARAGAFEEAVSATFPMVVHPDHLDRADLQAIHMRMALSVGAETYIRHQYAIMSRPDSRPDLAGIRVPTLVVVGATDQITTPEVAAEMAKGIPGAELATIEGAGHMALLEQPEAVNAAIVGWARG